MRRPLPFLALSAALLATAAYAAPTGCSVGLHSAKTAEIYFGRDESGAISDAEWRRFVEAEVTPRFPDRLAVADVYGQRRNPAAHFAPEPSKAVLVVLTGAPDDGQKLDLVRNAYAARFHQDSVLQVEPQACIAF
ncbi:MAG: DUF3574 domain-containing protein [Caulobacteraceae bacterium]